jgi:AraC-like DNA-binding protein
MAGMHRSHATRAFREYFGFSLKQSITRQRIATAQRLLATTRATVMEIAFQSGFQTSSRFYEAFRKQVRCSPRSYRRQLMAEREGGGTHWASAPSTS